MSLRKEASYNVVPVCMSKSNFIETICQPLFALGVLRYDKVISDIKVKFEDDNVFLSILTEKEEDQSKKVKVVKYENGA